MHVRFNVYNIRIRAFRYNGALIELIAIMLFYNISLTMYYAANQPDQQMD